MRRVARLVMAAFFGPCPKGYEVCHNNGVSSDDGLDNLRYGTKAENAADRIRHGTSLAGEKHPSARLTGADVLDIRLSDLPAKVLAARFGVHPGHVNNIRRGVRR